MCTASPVVVHLQCLDPTTGRHLRHTLTGDTVSQRVAEMDPGYGLICGVALMCAIGSVTGAPPSNYEKSDETKWGLRSVHGNLFVFYASFPVWEV